MRRVRDFRMKLHAIERSTLVLHRCEGTGRCGRERFEHIGQRVDLIAMTHPNGCFLRQTVQQVGIVVDVQRRATILTRLRVLYFGAQQLATDLHAVADAENRYAEFQQARVALRCAFFINTARTAAENQPFGFHRGQRFQRRVGRDKQTEDTRLTYTSGDELHVLRAKVEDGHDLADQFDRQI